MNEWRTIDSAPRQADVLICFRNGTVLPVMKRMDNWYFWNGDKLYQPGHITHWMPLPEPPSNATP